MDQENNPFNYGIPVSGQYFVGRWEQVKEMVRDLANPRGHSFALLGGRRFGKSSFLETLRDTLLEELVKTRQGKLYVFPVLVSLGDLGEYSAWGVFAHMLRKLYNCFTSSSIRKELDFDVTQTRLAAFVQSKEQACAPGQFSDILEEVVNLFADMYGSLRPVFLLDETEKILDQPWTEEIFSHLRSLIYISKLRDYVRCVLAGSSKLIEVREKGSQLLNMLKVVYLEAVEDKYILEIINWVDNVPEDFAQAVFRECGGQPYIAQYIMHYAWNSLKKGENPPISDLVKLFRTECHGTLTQWQTDIGEAGLVAYQILMEANIWLTEAQVKQQVHDKRFIPHIGSALINLCYHGLILERGIWFEYRVVGQLFKDWFVDEILPTLHIQPSSPGPLPEPRNPLFSIHDGEPTVTVMLPEPAPPSYPTAYCHVITKESFPFVTCKIDNAHPNCTNARITIETTIQHFSDQPADMLDVPSDRSDETILLPRLNLKEMLLLSNTSKANCHVLVKRLTVQGEQILHKKTYEIQLLAYNTALYATLDAQGNLDKDLTKFLAVFVTPNHQKIQDFIAVASNEHRDKEFIGYPTREDVEDASGKIDYQVVRNILQEQAKAFFNALKKHAKVRYVFSAASYGSQPHELTQRVRLPWEILPRDKGQVAQAYCLDGSILFASLLENLGIEPLIALVPGHAFVGWRVWRGSDEYDFLETTMIKDHNFNDALTEGNRQYREAIQKGADKRPLLAREGYLRVVDIAYYRKMENIDPLPLPDFRSLL